MAESAIAIYASIGANVAIAAMKFTAAAFTGSSAMVAEGVHSLVDAADGTLLLFGRHRSRRPPDAEHPFGYGRELYFWTLMVAILFFALGGGMSVYEGIAHLRHPEPMRDVSWNYVVLAAAALFDGASFLVAFRQFRRAERGRGLWEAVREGKDPSLFTVVLEDTADLIGIALAFLGVFLGQITGNPYFDGLASIGVGIVLAAVAVVLLIQSKALLIGERAERVVVDRIRAAASGNPSVGEVGWVRTMQLAPEEVLVTMDVRFRAGLSRDVVLESIARLEKDVRGAASERLHLYLGVEALVARPPDAPPPAADAREREAGGTAPPA